MPRQAAANSRYRKIIGLPGFTTLVECAQGELGLGTTPYDLGEDRGEIMERLPRIAWEIMNLCQVDAGEEVFVMNCLVAGVDQALTGKIEPTIRLLVPQLPLKMGMDLAVEIAHRVWPQAGEGPWLEVTQDGVPRATAVIGEDLPYQGTPPRCTLIRGRGVVALVARNGPRIYMDVTNASKEEITRAIPEIIKLRKELGIKAGPIRRGRPRGRDEADAVAAARLRRGGMSYVEIGKKFGWQVDEEVGTSQTAREQVEEGERVLDMVSQLQGVLAGGEG